jgi:hypothetical protein
MFFHKRAMIQIAALVLPGTFMASLAPLLDAFDLAQQRGERTIGAGSVHIPDFRLTLLSADGRDVALGRHARLRIDRAIAREEDFGFVWIPAFRAPQDCAYESSSRRLVGTVDRDAA